MFDKFNDLPFQDLSELGAHRVPWNTGVMQNNSSNNSYDDLISMLLKSLLSGRFGNDLGGLF